MSGPVLLLWRAVLRRSWRRALLVAICLAVGGSVALAAAAGARRTERAFDIVLDASNAGEIGSTYVPLDPEEHYRLVDGVPAVGAFTQRVGFQVVLPDEPPVPGLSSFAYYDDPIDVERPILLDGRLPVAANEVLVSDDAADVASIAVGESIQVAVAAPDFTSVGTPEAMTVVGIGIVEVYRDETTALPVLIFAKPFVAGHRESIAWGATVVRVAPGATRAEAIAQLQGIGLGIDQDVDIRRRLAADAIRPTVVTIWALALLAAIATVAVVVQAIQRLVRRSDEEIRSLATTGCAPRTLLAADLAVALTITVVGLAGAIYLAIAASPLFPQGSARNVPLLRGFDVDEVALSLGVVGLLTAIICLVTVATIRARRPVRRAPGPVPPLLAGWPAVATGVRFATGRRTLAGSVLAVGTGLAAVLAAVTFIGSLDRLVDRPHLSGFGWDVAGREPYASIDNVAVADALRSDDGIERITGLEWVDVRVDGRPVPASIWNSVKGTPWPTVTTGRAPQSDDEVLIGAQTLNLLGYDIGDEITISASGPVDQNGEPSGPPLERRLKVVGIAVSPAIGLAGTDTPRLDEGILLSSGAVAGRVFAYGSVVLFDLARGIDPTVVIERFPDGLPDDIGASTEWLESAKPAEVVQSQRSFGVLAFAVGAMLLGVLATIGLGLYSFVRDRRAGFAVLKTIGFEPRQIRTVVLAQAGAVVGAAMLLALPVGTATGRWLYQGFAEDIGVVVQPVVSVAVLFAAVAAVLGLVYCVALLPARVARRVSVSRELRGD